MSHIESFGVGTAIILLKKGKKVRRAGWICWLELDGAGSIRLRDITLSRPVDTAWVPVQADLMAVDWNIVE